VTDRALITLVWRALLGAARTPALWIAMGVQIAFLSLYLLVWGDGLPLAGARPVLDQFATTWYGFFDAGRAQRLEITGSRTSTSLTSLGLGVRATFGRIRGFLEVAKPGNRDPVSTGNRDARIFAGVGADF